MMIYHNKRSYSFLRILLFKTIIIIKIYKTKNKTNNNNNNIKIVRVMWNINNQKIRIYKMIFQKKIRFFIINKIIRKIYFNKIMNLKLKEQDQRFNQKVKYKKKSQLPKIIMQRTNNNTYNKINKRG